jgi:predicted  nucleic acid-binding Zn-ribbon protein
MGGTVEAFRRLQAVELKLAVIRREREARTRRIEAQKKVAKKAEERLQDEKRQRRERQVQIDGVQLEVSTREESVAKHRVALNKAKTNKEYASILTAMNTEKADNTRLEEEILKGMEEIQAFDQRIAQYEADLHKQIQLVAAAEKALQEYESLTAEEWTRLQGEKVAASAGLSPDALASFTRNAERHDGEAMAAVVRLHPKRDEWACSGCNIKVTLEVVNALQTRDDIQVCKVCGRVLYFDADAKARV